MFRNRFTMTSPRPASRRSSFRPWCEPLETRWVPTTVTNLSDSGPGSLRQAILDTPAGDLVDFQSGLSGIIALTTGELAIRKDLVINGADAALITVSGNNQSRVFSIAAGFNVEMYGLTIRDGYATGATGATGGGILNAGSLLLYGSNVVNNRAGFSSGSIVSASGSGGGIRNDGTLYVFYSAIGNNSAFASGRSSGSSRGGGIFNLGELYMQDSVVSANSTSSSGPQRASTSGAGIENIGTLTVLRSILRNNTLAGVGPNVLGYGAGLANGVGTATILDSAVVDNTANSAGDFWGGGISVTGGTVNVSNSTISGNRVHNTRPVGGSSNGGGLFVYNGDLNVTGSTVTRNTATAISPSARVGGGGLARLVGTVALRNTILADNTARQSPDVQGDVTSEGHNLIGNTEGGSGFSDTDLLGVDPLLGPLQDNGGYTLTHALLPGSPALDAGDPFAAPEWDQRGEGYSRIAGANIDIGAFEVQSVGPGSGNGRIPLDPGALAVLQEEATLARSIVTLPVASTQRRAASPDAAADLSGEALAEDRSRVPGRREQESHEMGNGWVGCQRSDAFFEMFAEASTNLLP